LAVGDNEGSKSPQPLKSLVSISLGSVLIHWSARSSDALVFILGGLPNKVLNQISLVLGQYKVLGLLHNLLEILNKELAICGKLL
jgi:hypothetical protein